MFLIYIIIRNEALHIGSGFLLHFLCYLFFGGFFLDYKVSVIYSVSLESVQNSMHYFVSIIYIEIKQSDEQKCFEMAQALVNMSCCTQSYTEHRKVQLNSYICIIETYSHLSMSSRLIKLFIGQDW